MISRFYDNTKLYLKSDRGGLCGLLDLKNGKFVFTIQAKDTKMRRYVSRHVGLAAVIDMAKLICDAVDFKCKKCKKKLSIERGEVHHGCLSCL
jgi:hypothetical protein